MLYPQNNPYRQFVVLAEFWGFKPDPEDRGREADWGRGSLAAYPLTDIAGGLPGKKQIHNRLDEVDIIVATGYYYRNQPKDELFSKALLKPVKPIANPSKIYSWRTSRAADGGL
jgi:hypothetical protein